MTKFNVTIIETLAKTMTVDAKDEITAFWKVRDGWRSGDYILYPEDFAGVEFETSLPQEDDEDVILHKYDNKGKMINIS